MASAFRRCYNKGLAENPDMVGSVTVTAKIGPNGEVTNTQTAWDGSVSSSVIGCVAGRVAAAKFSPPTGGTATIVIPVTLSHE